MVDAEVLLVIHCGAKEEVFDVDAHVAGCFVCIGDGAVDVSFCVKYGDCWGSWFIRTVEVIPAGGHVDAVGLYFL